jgi:MFS family permease
MDVSMTPHAGEPALTTWSPLRSRVFTVILLTGISVQTAVFMNGLASAWSITELTDSPVVVSSLQAAVALPGFLLALLAGALADVASRKRLIIFAQAGSVVVTGIFALLAWTGGQSVASLLILTAVLGVLTGLAAPSWIAIIPGLVPIRELAGAMTLSSAGVSVAMALGPALGGFIIAASDPTVVFAINSVVFMGGLFALSAWKPQPRTGLPPEHLMAAMRVGLQYAW